MTLLNDVYSAVLEANKRISEKGLYRTPLQRALWLEDGNSQVFLKLESEQVTGSFKARGAMNKILSLSENDRKRGIVTASTGNHALATTFACQNICQMDPTFKYQIFLPNNASVAKIEHLQALGAPLSFYGSDCLSAELAARKLSEETGAVYISPYNDMSVLAGQGTIGVEIFEQIPKDTELHSIFIPVGGGGLISGIASYVKKVSPNTKVYGCAPKNDAHMGRSIKMGKLMEGDDYLENNGVTISEGTAGAVENGSITFDICKEVVDEWLELTEEEIGQAVVDILAKHHKAVEGAAGLGVAGYRRLANELAGKNVAIVLCGGNVNAQIMKSLLNTHL